MPRKTKEIAAGVALDVVETLGSVASDPDTWPAKVDNYADALAIVTSLWGCDRAYSVQDLACMAQARFEVSRQRRLPGYYLNELRRIAKRWAARERARAMGHGMVVPGYPSLPATATPLDPVAAVQLDQLSLETAAAAGFRVM